MSDSDVFMPRSSIEHSWDIGVKAHTNHLLYVGPELYPSQEFPSLEDAPHGPFAGAPGPAGFHPSDIQQAYGDFASGGGTIAIVDAYDAPNSLPDFNTFSANFGLASEPSNDSTASTNRVFQVVYASGAKPTSDGGWAQEMSLDIEWAHAMAPLAKIVLVEARSANFSDLLQAVDVAAGLPGVTQVSISWGGSEFSGESAFDAHFAKAGVTFFVSSGDSPGERLYPAASPNVVSVGGTSLRMNASGRSETAWSGSGGGRSVFERSRTYQSALDSLLVRHRGIPDVAADADPATGVAVYDSFAYQGFHGWFIVGGTSLSAPLCAAIANAGGAKRGSSELNFIYGHAAGFFDIVTGVAGTNSARHGWDFVTGWGSPKSSSSF